MADTYLLAVDVGTSGVKALAVTTQGEIVSQQWRPYGLYHPQPGYAEQDPDEILNQTRAVILAVRNECGRLPVAISWSSVMHGLMAVAADGRPLTPLFTWADLRSTAEARHVHDTGEADTLLQSGGTPIHPMTPLCKLMWLRMHQPELFRASYKFVSIKECIFFRLTASWVVDYSIASATGLFRTSQLRWNETAVRLAGVNAQKLSTPVPTTHVMTIQTDWLGAEWQGVRLVTGASDGCLAQLGAGATTRNTLSITIGTSSAVREMIPAFELSGSAKLFCYYLNDGQYVRGGASNNGTSAIDWYCKTFAPTIDSLEGFARNLDTNLAGAGGLLFLPYLLGERAPHYNPDATGAFFGMTSAHTAAHFHQAVAEGVCLAVKSIVKAVTGGNEYQIYVSGGFARSPVLVQLLTNVLQQPVSVRESPEASAIGAARLGFDALGIQAQWQEPAAVAYLPDQKLRPLYSDQFERYQALYRALEPMFQHHSNPA
jgi:gluconokinase